MRKAEAQATLKKGAEGEACGMAPPSPRIPPKRAKVSADQVVPDPADSVYPTPTPPVFIRKMRNAAVGLGCDIRLKVAVAGDPQPSLYWYCNEELLDMENQEYGGLWIRDCKPSDAGLYTCIANNYLGEAKTSAVLAVLDLGEDSENTEDEAAEPQIPMQNKEGPAGLQDQAAHRVPAGDSDRMMDVTSDASGRRGSRTDSWAGSEDTVVEKEAPALGSRAPGPQDLTKPARSQSEDVLREAHPQVLPPPSPKFGQRSTTPPIPTRSGSAPSTPLTPRKKVVVPSDYVDTVPAEFEDKIKQPKSSAMSQSSNQDSRPQTPVSEVSRKDLTLRPSPKLARASSKIFEKVRVFEERRKSIDNPEGSISGRSWAGFNRAASIDSDDGGSRLGISRESSREDLRDALKADAAERRSMFRQRAASLEDRPRYSQKVQDIESKFTEELRRIKKLVGKPHLAKSFSTEQLSQRSRQPLRKLEPIPPQVLQKLQMRERNLQEEEKRSGQQKDQSPQRSPEPEQKPEAQKKETVSPPQQPETSKSSISSETMSRFEEKEITPEAMSVAELPGQRSARPPARSSPVREPPQSSIVSGNPDLAEDQSPVSPLHKGEPPPRKVEVSVRQVERRPPSPLVQRGSPFARELTRSPDSPVRDSLRDEPMPRKVNPPLRKVEQRPPSPLVQQEPRTTEHHVQAPTKPPRLARPSPPPRSPVSEQESMEVQAPPAPSAPKRPIPVIVVEEEPMEVSATMEVKEKVTKKGKEGAPPKARGKGCRARPMSPELESSDDSYVSAGEDPLEAPIFELPLQDTIASAGSDVLLSCVIAGTPDPEVTWRKEDVEMKNSTTHTVKVEGERHSLLIKKTKPSDAGTYCVTATNEVGRATCTATLFVQAEPRQEARGALSVPMDLCSPITSDEEYLSPMEEGMDFGGPTYRRPEPRKIVDARFRESPSFQVTLTDQAVIEGQEVTMCVRMTGQPKPMIYWLRDRVTIKTAGRHIVRETEDGTFEMKITSTLRSDMGVYTCKIVNEYGSQQCECRLEVKAAPAEPVLSVMQHVTDMTVNAGETALFECHMTGPQDVDVDWLSDGRLIQPALLNCKMHFDGKRCRLLLNSVHEDDSGTYTCKLSTAKEELTSSATLKVIPSVPPLFTRKLDVLEVIEGRTARFDCKISGTPPPRVCWSHFEHTIADSENVRILREGGRHSLVIMHVTSENEGFYTITARNAHGEAECAAELYVQEPRPAISAQMAKLEKMPSIPEEPEMTDGEMERFTMPDFVKPLYDLDVVEGKEAVLKCKVAGLPYPTITWFHNGKKIENTDERKMTQYRDIHSLVIRCVCHAHGGVYKSVISNKVGKAACYAHLYVTDVLPDPPDGAAVIQEVTGKTVTLSWRKPRRLDPSLDPSSLMYAIQQQAIGSVQWTIIVSGLRQTSYTLTSLCKGVYYSFRVLSTINKTYSKPSPPTEPVQLLDRGPYLQEAPVIIDKPDVVYIVGNQSLSITVTLNHVQAAVTWKKQDVVLEHTVGMFEMGMPDDDQHTLKLVKVRSSDVGQIICMASNQFGSDSCILTLERAVPPTFESIMEDLDVQIGETPRFAVVVEGKPVPDIMWYKNDTLLSDSSHFSFVYDDNECSLVVLNVQEEDSGVYTCTAKNLAGVVSCKAELTVRIAAPDSDEAMEDEESVLRKMRRLTDYYDIHKEIGRGAFSYVKRVSEKTSKEEYAAKFISARAKKKTSALREMRLLSRLDHERILYFHDAFEKKNAVIVITELCHEEFLDKLTKKSSIMESEIRSITRQLLEGVSYLHQNNIMHLDMKPENILMADSSGEQIRICDFGNAVELTPDEAQYCKYGTPEFVAPEIVNQTPVCKATDIWPVGVMTYLCLTGVSPFAGENDRCTLLNIRNYNVAFEEGMFADLCREAKGFVIKLLVAERLRPDANECLRHPWFKLLTKGKSISTESLKQFLSRRKWQRSLISYKSKMVMRSIPELLDDSSNHISIAVPRHLKEGSPPPSSSSDSDEDIDELPFIPMPHIMDFSGSRMSLTEIPGDEDDVGRPNGTDEGVGKGAQGVTLMECEPSEKDGSETAGRGRARKRATQEEAGESSDEETAEAAKRPDQPKRPLRKGSSMDSEKGEGVRRRGELRRGSSADSALLLHIKPEEGTDEGAAEDGKKVLKKAVSMELPRRSPSPGTGKMSQEDYALKLELMRQRLLRGGAVDNKMSGLRGPLLETLGMTDEKRYSSLDRYTRPSRLGVAPLIRAASSESPRDDTHKTKVLRKSASFSQGDAEPIPLHRRSGAPLEIPLAQIEERRLQEAPSMSALTEQPRLDSLPATPKELSKPPTPELDEQEQVISSRMKQDAPEESRRKLLVDQGDGASERRMRMLEEEREEKVIKECERVTERMSQSEMTPSTVEEETELKVKDEREKEYYAIRMTEDQEKHQGTSPEITVTTSSITLPSVATKMAPTYISSSPPSRVTLPDGRTSAYASIMQTIIVPSLQPADTSAHAPATPTIASTPTPTPTSVEPEPPSWTEHPAVFSRVASTEQPAKEPSPTKTPTLPRETSAGQDIEDITSEEIFESRFKKRESSLTRGLKLLTKSKGEEKQSVEAPSTGEEIYRPGPIGAPLEFSRRLEKSKSVQDLREASKDSSFMKRFSMRLKRSPSAERKEEIGTPDSGTLRRRLSWNLGRNKTQDKKEVEMVRLDGVAEPQLEEEARETKKSTESPVLVMRKKIESTVAGISMRIRSHSMDRREEKEDKEAKPESKRTPLLSILRRTSSEGVNLKKIGQSSATASTESLESTSSIQSETSTKTTESERRSRWDRWGLTRGRKDKTVSQPDIPSAIARENGSLRGRQYSRLASDFPPVFHIKLRDHVLLEGDPVTLSCLPAGSPHPRITWMKDKKKLHIDARMNAISCPDGRQLLMIMKTTKNDAGLYECVASNPLATVTSSCLISLARLPNRPGTPEIPQKYKNTALVLWRPSDTLAPCTYSLERRTEGETNWLIVATGVAECYYNATDLPEGGTFRFRVACVNKAGQGPYSNLSEKVCLDTTGAPKPSGVVVVKTIPSPKPSAGTSEADLTIEPTVPSEALEPSGPPVPTSSEDTPPQEPGLLAPTSTRTTPPPESGPRVPTPSRISPPRGTAEEVTTSEPLARTPTPTAAATPPPSTGPSPPSPHTITPVQISPTVTPTKAKTTLNITVTTTSSPAPPTESPAPPVQSKSLSPVSIAPPTSQTTQVSPPPLVSPPPAIGKPISSVPLYVPATTAPALPAGPALSPPVVLVTSLSPVGDGTATPSRMTPTGRATPSGRITPSGRRTPSGKPGESSLRQGVPQKPYTFMDEKARGRFGVIRECRENATGKLFMAKIVPYEPDSKQTVLQEYDILKSLHHSRIMALHEAYVTPRYLVLISECCPGKEVLYSLIDRFRYSEDDVVTYLVQILQGLDYLHNRRILHLDIKPDNIIITPMNSVKIIDFGSAQTFNPLFLKQFGRRVGTLEFMSPEMVKGDVVGPPADMWSVGVLTFIMLSGRLPFVEKDPKDTEAKIQVARFDLTKLYPNVSQSASLFLKKILCSYPWARPTIKDCFSNSWLQDAYLMKLRRQTLTFTTTRLKEFLVEHQRRRTETATKHKVLLRSYQSTAQSPATPTTPTSPTTPVPTSPTPVSTTPVPTTPGTK